jgi:large subunit ribosomal protein L29
MSRLKNRREDLRTKTEDQLGSELGNLKREAFNLRFQAATSQLEKPSRVTEVRKDIARIKTLQNQRSAEAARGQNERSRSAAK